MEGPGWVQEKNGVRKGTVEIGPDASLRRKIQQAPPLQQQQQQQQQQDQGRLAQSQELDTDIVDTSAVRLQWQSLAAYLST